MRVTEYKTSVEIVDLTSRWLPVAFPAVAVNGVDGDWSAMIENGTVISRTRASNRQIYEVVTHVPRPTLEQIRDAEAILDAEAVLDDAADDTKAVPSGRAGHRR